LYPTPCMWVAEVRVPREGIHWLYLPRNVTTSVCSCSEREIERGGGREERAKREEREREGGCILVCSHPCSILHVGSAQFRLTLSASFCACVRRLLVFVFVRAKRSVSAAKPIAIHDVKYRSDHILVNRHKFLVTYRRKRSSSNEYLAVMVSQSQCFIWY